MVAFVEARTPWSRSYELANPPLVHKQVIRRSIGRVLKGHRNALSVARLNITHGKKVQVQDLRSRPPQRWNRRGTHRVPRTSPPTLKTPVTVVFMEHQHVVQGGDQVPIPVPVQVHDQYTPLVSSSSKRRPPPGRCPRTVPSGCCTSKLIRQARWACPHTGPAGDPHSRPRRPCPGAQTRPLAPGSSKRDAHSLATGR